MSNNRLVYIKFRLDGRPCYVGKGDRNRPYSHERGTANIRLARIIAKSGRLPTVIIRKNLSNEEACRIEVALIAAIVRSPNGPLVNMTDGGEGRLGLKHTEESKLKMSIASKGKPKSDIAKMNMSLAKKGRKQPAEMVAKRATALKGHNVPEAAKEQMGAANRGKIRSEETRRKLSLSHMGHKSCLKGKPRSPEVRARISAALKARHELRREFNQEISHG